MKYKKRALIICILLIMLLCAACGNNSKEGVLAEVDGHLILEEDFDREFEIKRKIYVSQHGEDFLKQELEEGLTIEEFLKEELLFEIIHEHILSKELDKLNMAVTQEDIDEYIQNNYINRLGGEENYDDYLDSLGVSSGDFRKIIARELMYERHSQHFYEQIDLSEDEVRDYYEKNKDVFIKVRASHILVKTEEEGREVLRRLQAGEDFASLAAIMSIDTNSAVKGGDLGYFTKGSMAEQYKEIEEAAFSLKEGEVSNLIKTDFGYHIVLIEDRVDSFEDLKEEAEKALKNKKYYEELNRLMEKANVKVYMDLRENKSNLP